MGEEAQQGTPLTGGVAAGSTPTGAGGTSPWRGVGESSVSDTGNVHPTRVGRYRLDRLLGRGGFGRVYLGFDEQLGRAVAVKIAHPGRVNTAERAEAFLAEARALARVDHPNILPVYDAGRDGPLCYVVSRYVEGTDLGARLANGPVPWAEAIRIAGEVAQALHHAHLRGLVHRDVKPNNILLDATGKAYLADFGLALRAEDFGRGPEHAGTPAYMSPEQAAGRGHTVDARSDVFCLGTVLYEMLTGRNPFRAATAEEALHRVATLDPPPPRQVNAAIPPELERVCLKALAKPLTERYTTAKDLADALAHVLAAPGGGAGASGRARRRLTVAACSGLALVVVATAVYLPRDRAPGSAPPVGTPAPPEGTGQPPGYSLAPPPHEPAAPVALVVAEEAPAPRPVLVRVYNPRWQPCALVLPIDDAEPARRALTGEERAILPERGIRSAWVTKLTNGRLVCDHGPRECAVRFVLQTVPDLQWAQIETIEVVVVAYRPLPRYAYDDAKKVCGDTVPDAEDEVQNPCEESQAIERLYYAEIDRPKQPGEGVFASQAFFTKVAARPPTFSRSTLQLIRVARYDPESFLLRVNARTPGVYDIECWVTTDSPQGTTRRQVGERMTYLFDTPAAGK